MAIHLSDSIKLGFTDIMMRKVRSAVTVIGIVLGVMCIMVVLAIVSGMNKITLDWMQERGGLNKIEVGPNWNYDFSKGGDPSFTLKEIRYIDSQIPEAIAFNPTISEWDFTLNKGDKSFSGWVGGVMPDFSEVEEWYVDKGRFIKDIDIAENNNVIVLGTAVVEQIFGKRNPLGESVNLNGQTLTVVGVMQYRYMKPQGGGAAFSDNQLSYLNERSYIPLSTMLSKIMPGAKISSLEIKAANPQAAVQLKTKLENIVLNLKAGKKLFEVSAAQEEMENMNKNSQLFGVIFVLIAVISLLVGGIVIMNIMLAAIKERTREIGVRLAIGARGRDIFLQFLVQTVLITTLGGILGIAFGFAILEQVGKFLQISVIANLQMIWAALSVSVGVGMIFGVAPAVRASRLDPVIALRED
ncbi:MAG: ABC transporter permease [Candidatus Cloacimonetes bacterium]|nr:ABC transporter permease [Candidatus Cloacimonadota bacterium]